MMDKEGFYRIKVTDRRLPAKIIQGERSIEEWKNRTFKPPYSHFRYFCSRGHPIEEYAGKRRYCMTCAVRRNQEYKERKKLYASK